MRKNIILFIAAMLLVSCSADIPTSDEIQVLIAAIPDHGIKKGSEKHFTSEYYSLLEHAWAIPSDAIGGIGSEEWLYYFISGNDMPDNVPLPELISTVPTTFGTVVTFRYLDMEHRIELTKESGAWVISDFDDTLGKLEEYIDRQREYFKSDEWKQYLDNTRKELGAEAAAMAEKEVDEYFSQYR